MSTKIFALISIFLYLAFFPLASKINFYNNDDWVYYRMVERFKQGNFVLESISAPTFYLQGLLVSPFELSAIPEITLLISVLNFFIFSLILRKHLSLNIFSSVLLGLLLFFNPLHMYSAWGFMTENYFLLFVLLSLYFILEFLNSGKVLPFLIANSLIVAGFFIRQLSFVTSLSLAIYLILSKRFKWGLLQLFLFLSLYAFYVLVFPRTAEMFEKPLEFTHLKDFNYSFSLAYASLIYLCAFTVPFFISKTRLKTILLAIPLFFVLNHFFKPGVLAWGEFPYLDNVWERTGFYPRGLTGTKYHFFGIFDLYKYWDLVAKAFTAIFISNIFYKFVFRQNNKSYLSGIVDYNLIFISVYTLILVLSQKTYDRYLLVMLPFFILYLIQNVQIQMLANRINTVTPFLFGFVLFLSFYSTQLSYDFVMVNKYVWTKSLELSKHTPKARIQGNNPWKLTTSDGYKDYIYKFTYDSFERNPELRCCYILEDTYNAEFPFSIFINPKVYLYKKAL